ncbi:MAG TPA: arginine deiminase-related protein [Pseudobdellovibrionaceae bacterium]|nr:arginine deiminase-related protein [Pseudobdellovibrionaceae bacterium]
MAWSINPHMVVGTASPIKAMHQHARFVQTLREVGAHIILLPFLHAAYDSVFVKDSAILKQEAHGISALVTKPSHDERKMESRQRQFHLERRGIEVVDRSSRHLEGGDVVVSHSLGKVFMGYGFRTEREAAKELSNFFESEVIPLELKDPHFYHLDVALSILKDGTAFACREAFTAESWERLQSCGLRSLVQVTKQEAMKFGLNWVEINDSIVMGSHLPRLKRILRSMGKSVYDSPLDQFQLAGGSAACLVSELHDFESPSPHAFAAGHALSSYEKA